MEIIKKQVVIFVSAVLLIFCLINNHVFAASSGYLTEQISFTKGAQVRSKTITIPHLKSVVSVSVNTGNVAYSVSGDNITLHVKNGNWVSRDPYTNPQKYSKAVSKSITKNINSFPSSVSYSDTSGYTGTLNKYGSSQVIKGSYTPKKTKTVTQTHTLSDTKNPSSFPSYFNYNSGGFSGRLNKAGSYTFTQTGTITRYTDYWIRNTLNYQQKPTTKPTYEGSWWRIGLYEFGKVYVYYPARKRYSTGYYYNNHASVSKWKSVGGAVSTNGSWTWSNYYNNHGGNKVFKWTSSSWLKPVFISHWGWKRKVGHFNQKYSGTVTKPATDTRVWKQNYSGTVYKPGTSYRNYKYAYKVTIHFTKGPLSISSSPSNAVLPNVTLDGTKQTIFGGFSQNNLTIEDYRGTGQGYHLTATASQLINQNGKKLPKGSLVLLQPKTVQVLDGSSITPKIKTGPWLIDKGSYSVLSAAQNQGMGKYKILFSNKALRLTLNPATTYVNQSSGNSSYHSTITWTVVSGP